MKHPKQKIMKQTQKKGAPFKYTEPTVQLGSIRVPTSKRVEIRQLVYNYLEQFKK